MNYRRLTIVEVITCRHGSGMMDKAVTIMSPPSGRPKLKPRRFIRNLLVETSLHRRKESCGEHRARQLSPISATLVI